MRKADLAERSEISRACIARLKTRHHDPGPNTVAKLAKVLKDKVGS